MNFLSDSDKRIRSQEIAFHDVCCRNFSVGKTTWHYSILSVVLKWVKHWANLALRREDAQHIATTQSSCVPRGEGWDGKHQALVASSRHLLIELKMFSCASR